MILRVAGEDVGQARLDADADQRQPAGGRPRLGARELLVTELHAGPLVGRLGIRMRQRHRHVEVIGTGRERALEDRHHEARVDRVEDVADPVLPAERRDVLGARCIDPGRDEPWIAGLPGDRPIGAGAVVVGHDHALEERPSRGDRDDRAADATRADDEDPHHEPASLQSIDPVKQWASFEQAP